MVIELQCTIRTMTDNWKHLIRYLCHSYLQQQGKVYARLLCSGHIYFPDCHGFFYYTGHPYSLMVSLGTENSKLLLLRLLFHSITDSQPYHTLTLTDSKDPVCCSLVLYTLSS